MGLAILYLLVALGATTIGAVTGMGGGVIIKPVLDGLNHYDVSTINLLSSVTVLAMAMVSVAKQVHAKTKMDFSIAVPLALGSIAGGSVGGMAINSFIESTASSAVVFFIQNIALSITLVLVFVYMKNKNKIRPLGVKGVLPSLLVGGVLGAISSFLGIGGGPLNVALIILVFSFPTKKAAISSLVVILFAQSSKMVGLLLENGFANHDLSMLGPMIFGAIAGGLIGSQIHNKLPEKKIELLFNGVQAFILCICVLNIIRNWP